MEKETDYPDFILVIKYECSDEEVESIKDRVKNELHKCLILFTNGSDVELYQKEETYKKVF